MKQNLLSHLKLCVVTKPHYHSLEESHLFIERILQGGVTMIQARDKSGDYETFKEHARALQQLTTVYKVPLIINDTVFLAREIGAEGVHLGQSDMHPDKARAILGPDAIIGLSIESEEELEASTHLTSIDYISASAIFASKTKTNYKKLWGIEGLKKVVERSVHPVMAIGGITALNVHTVMNAGASGIAVIGALYDSPDSYHAAIELKTYV